MYKIVVSSWAVGAVGAVGLRGTEDFITGLFGH